MTIANFTYGPTPLFVKLGGSVSWSNTDATEHTATADNGTTFDTGAITHAVSKTVTFSTVGTVTYHCAFHPFMRASVTVAR